MKPIRFILAALTFAGLAGCYTSDKPLITDETSATPYQKITFYNENDKPLTYAVDGKRYKATDENGEVSYLNLQSVEDDYYVAQLSSDQSNADGPQILYAYIRLDADAKKALLWKMVGSTSDVRPGLHECDQVICIDDLKAYIDYAKEGIAAGAPPDSEMKIDIE